MRFARPLALTVVALALAACAGTTPGWTYAPAPPGTPPPSAAPSATVEPSVAPSEAASGQPSEAPGGSVLKIAAQNIEFDKGELSAPAGVPFQIAFSNNDPGVPHNVAIRDANGGDIFTGEIFAGVGQRTYDIPAIPAGTYKFICTVHINMVGTLTVQ